MADPKKKLPRNVAGEFFVDSTCIDCDTCRQLAPETFGDDGEFSYVFHQPEAGEETRKATRALLACPTGSIGTMGANDAKTVMHDFPLSLEDDVYYVGFNSPKSFGGNSYFVRHPEGNWLIDSPKYLPYLAERFKAMGGLKYIFLTHQDDVAEAERYAETFGARRIIHREDLEAQPEAECVLEGTDPVPFGKDFLVIPTPGHTAGHCVLLYRNRYLFTGDHLWWNRDDKRLGASRSYCWHSWAEQVQSMKRLMQYPFQWVLAGHGDRIHLPAADMQAAMAQLVDYMEASLQNPTASR